MTSSLKARHAPRYLAVARLLLKHRSALSRPWDPAVAAAAAGGAVSSGNGAVDTGPLDDLGDDRKQSVEEDARALADELVRMGPTFVKLGQLLSTRADLLPAEYLEALAGLREDVDPLPPGEAQRVIEEELGGSDVFESFEPEPIAAASLGQVHRAVLQGGRSVAVKVQRPGIRQQAVEDMEVIAELAAFVDEHSEGASRFGFTDMVGQFRQSLIGELDYRREAANQKLMGAQLFEFESIVVPQPVDDYTTSRVLTMDLVEGQSLTSLDSTIRPDVDYRHLAEELIGAYLDMVLVNGFFHADPHPGNLLLADDGRLALIDLGMIARVSPEAQGHLLRLLLAMSSSDGSGTADALEHLGTPLETFDRGLLRERVTGMVLRYRGATVGDLPAGQMVSELAMACSACGLRPNAELTLLAKALLSLDEAARILDPSTQIDRVVESHAARVMRHRMMQAIAPANVMRSALDAAAFVEALPRRMNKILESVSEGKLTINLEGLDEPAILRGAQKLANRVAIGVLIAAFVIAAALFSSERTGAFLWGYPVLTLVFLGLAVVVAGWVVLGMVRGDLPRRDKAG